MAGQLPAPSPRPFLSWFIKNWEITVVKKDILLASLDSSIVLVYSISKYSKNRCLPNFSGDSLKKLVSLEKWQDYVWAILWIGVSNKLVFHNYWLRVRLLKQPSLQKLLNHLPTSFAESICTMEQTNMRRIRQSRQLLSLKLSWRCIYGKDLSAAKPFSAKICPLSFIVASGYNKFSARARNFSSSMR